MVEKVYRNYSTIDEIINDKISSNIQERSFYVADMFDIYNKHMKWCQLMPRVKPFYAVKSNSLPQIVSFLASLGTGFDCASKQEIDQVLSLGVHPDRIIYANPCKTKSFIKHAYSVNVNLMTFDNEMELHKVSQLHPNAKLVLRIKGNDETSRCKFNIKFGADLNKCYDLLKIAKQLELEVVGISFHNGSFCEGADAYYKSIAASKLVFDMARELGHQMTLLDIGGGFPGDSSARVSFEELAQNVNKALDAFFPLGSGVDIIAEPGRFYVASSMTLATMVIAKRVEYDATRGQDGYMYYLNDGVYSAFNNIIYDHASPEPELFEGVMNYDTCADSGGSDGDDYTTDATTNDDSDNDDSDNVSMRKLSTKANSLSHTNNINNNMIINTNTTTNTITTSGSDNRVNENKKHVNTSRKLRSSIMWGPTCDSMDCIKRDFMFPELQVGDWVVFKNMGAYTCCAASTFNGFERASVIIADKRVE